MNKDELLVLLGVLLQKLSVANGPGALAHSHPSVSSAFRELHQGLGMFGYPKPADYEAAMRRVLEHSGG